MTDTATRPAPTAAQWALWTTTVRVVVTDPAALDDACARLRAWLASIEETTSRFRADSEVSRIARSDADEHRISPLLSEILSAALTAAATSGGRVDPTIGTVIARLETAPTLLSTARPTTWRDVGMQGRTLRMPAHTLLDLGATGKAFAADRAATIISDAVGCGVLVSLGGDLRVAGPDPDDGWSVLVQDGEDEPASMVDLRAARAIATSSTRHRRVGLDRAHHIVDPLTMRPVQPVWRTVSLAASTCVQANTWSTAAIVEGAGAPRVLAETGLPARLVGVDGQVVRLGGWPA